MAMAFNAIVSGPSADHLSRDHVGIALSWRERQYMKLPARAVGASCLVALASDVAPIVQVP